jgi:hypothetical protein
MIKPTFSILSLLISLAQGAPELQAVAKQYFTSPEKLTWTQAYIVSYFYQSIKVLFVAMLAYKNENNFSEQSKFVHLKKTMLFFFVMI